MIPYFIMRVVLAAALLALVAASPRAWAGANPNIPFYGYNALIANPTYPLVGENTHFTVQIGNSGDAAATNVQVKLSYNDWGVTFFGWQEIGTVTISTIPAGGTATAEFDFVFENRAHTCVEAIIIGADENTNTNDDRAQINLEVIHAGTEFVYGVPIVNNGDAPLNLQIVGHCGDAAGVPGRIECERIDEKVELQPGEEMLIPVELHFPPDTAPGTVVEFQVDAYDLDNPGDPNAHNHVLLRVIFATPRQLKSTAKDLVIAARDGADSKPLRNRLDAIAGQLGKAVGDRSWQDDANLQANGGARVFAKELVAAHELVQLLGTDLPATVKAGLDKALRNLVDADRMLAQRAITVVSGDPAAESLLAAGDASRLAGEYVDAIQNYAAAWRAALN